MTGSLRTGHAQIPLESTNEVSIEDIPTISDCEERFKFPLHYLNISAASVNSHSGMAEFERPEGTEQHGVEASSVSNCSCA